MHIITVITFFLLAYCIGSINSSIIICKLFGFPDPRETGSGNPGTTNVLRFTNKKITIAVLLLDVLKGFVIVILAKYFFVEPFYVGLMSLAVVLGHIFPIYYHFKGGKGIATALGAFLVLIPYITIIALAIWILVVLLTRYSSLASIIATIIITIMTFIFAKTYALPVFLVTTIIIYRHKVNIIRLLNKTETKIGIRK